ncbi:MAG TPA: SGNH/GDSL hydrolase family protein [Pyrinomonadaceae bacterium]|nr:SGNH/GDSL hydrolase family protein [Pyrinomonadaceae bacterium]
MNRKRSRAKKLFAKLLLVLMGFIFGGAIAEVALRAGGYSYPEFYKRDEVCGVSLLPGAEGWYRKEGEAYVRINSDGLRDEEHALTKAADTFRIAVIGDSYCEALSVPVEAAFWLVMRRDLQECAAFRGKQIEVINFGVSGYGTAQELLTLREKVWKYSPDLVLLAITTNNDITDNTRALKKTDDAPYFVYRGDQLTLDDSFKHSRAFLFSQSRVGRMLNWLRINSRSVQAITQGQRGFKVLLASWRAKRSAKSGPEKQDPGGPGDSQHPTEKSDLFARSEELGTDNLVYLEPPNPVWSDAWRVTEGLIVQMRDDVIRGGAKFVVVTLSNGPQVLPDANLRERFKQRFGITDLLYPDNRIKALGSRERISVITLAPALQEFAEQNKVFLHGFGEDIGNGHWNITGHRVAGQLIAKKICEDALLK